MRKKTIANSIMVAVILLIAAAGVLITGHIQGWFDKADGNAALLTEFRGIITLERQGVAYAPEADTVLRKGDKITCDPGATVQLRIGDGYITLGQSATVEITEPAPEAFAATVTGGEAFVNAASEIALAFDGRTVVFKDTVATLSVRAGAQSISVYSGEVEGTQEGQLLEWIGGERSVRAFGINSLNDFNITQLRTANENKTLCFSNEDLDRLEADRWAEMQAQLTAPTESTTPPEATTPPETTIPPETTAPSETTAPLETTTPPETTAPPETTTPPETTAPIETTVPQETEPQKTCTITILCDTILNNWSDLDPAKAGYVPSSGCILPAVTVAFTEGETVFDVLKRVCTSYGIQLEYSWTPMYNSYYIEGINHLYEFDCGSESGWMYKVNGWFPNYGCSAYVLQNGDSIVWCYSCKGYGADVGGGSW